MTTADKATQGSNQGYRYLDFITAMFVTVLVVSNIASSAKIVDWGINIFGMNMAFDAGTLLFPLSYIFGDILTEVYGYARARRVIWVGFACNLLAVMVIWLSIELPPAPFWTLGSFGSPIAPSRRIKPYSDSPPGSWPPLSLLT